MVAAVPRAIMEAAVEDERTRSNGGTVLRR